MRLVNKKNKDARKTIELDIPETAAERAARSDPGQSYLPNKKTIALKYDDGKLPLNLLPFEALTEVAHILEHGRSKYGANNWRSGLRYMRVIAAVLRHLFAFIGGEDCDPDTGRLHTAHAICGLLFLTSYQLHPPKSEISSDALDDRIRLARPLPPHRDL